MPPKLIKKEQIKYKDIITVGEVGVSANMPETIMVPKVKCNLVLFRDVHTCLHCPFNRGRIGNLVMKCIRKAEQEVPNFPDTDYDIENTKKEVDGYGRKEQEQAKQ